MASTNRKWCAAILAGQRPGTDPLATHYGGKWKALIPVGGEPMLAHVVRTLRQCEEIDRIIILAQDPLAMAEAARKGGGVDAILSSQSSISASIANVAGSERAEWPILVTTADHPLLTSEMVTQFLADAAGADLAVGMVEKKTMQQIYGDSPRTWLKFADGHWSGANLFSLASAATLPALRLWANAEQDRKIPWKLFRHFGPMLMLRALTRTIGLDQGLARAGLKLGISARLVDMADPAAAIDVDKPADHALAERILAARSLAPREQIQ
jgi:CTP:molybdopterin cytidylyltransferase MocA